MSNKNKEVPKKYRPTTGALLPFGGATLDKRTKLPLDEEESLEEDEQLKEND